jgi:ATP synthase subunit 6
MFELTSFYLFLCSVLFLFIFLVTFSNKIVLPPKSEDLEAVNDSGFTNSFKYSLTKFIMYFSIFTKSQLVSIRQFRFIGLFFTIFVVIFLLNVLSLIAFNPSVTGHLVVTLLFSVSLFLGFIIIGFLNFDEDYYTYFVPKDVPEILLPFLVVIEVLSFIIRPFSLGIRLFANMLAGHTLMGIFAKFGIYIIGVNILFLIFPILIIVPVLLLEIGVALVQSYIFINLLFIYMNDVYEINH